MIALYHQTKTPISFWCRQGLNPRFLLQSSETLPVDLTGTHKLVLMLRLKKRVIIEYFRSTINMYPHFFT